MKRVLFSVILLRFLLSSFMTQAQTSLIEDQGELSPRVERELTVAKLDGGWRMVSFFHGPGC